MVKHFAMVVLLLSSYSQSNCQITKKNWLVGGVISYASIQRNSEIYGLDQTAYELNITPNIGYFLVDKLAVGVKFGINSEGGKGQGTQGTFNKRTYFNVGPYARYYLLSPVKNLNIVTECGYQYGFIKGNSTDVQNVNSFFIQAGPVIYFNSVVGIEFLISYTGSKSNGYSGIDNTIMVGVGLQVHLQKD
jgi:hypothetical protein